MYIHMYIYTYVEVKWQVAGKQWDIQQIIIYGKTILVAESSLGILHRKEFYKRILDSPELHLKVRHPVSEACSQEKWQSYHKDFSKGNSIATAAWPQLRSVSDARIPPT